ncbi:Uncharacterised protein [Vibrio cholerae]|uniref:Uncharacterized protein n=1 Tax=Vibrio cholerae TaxID=666 RepID=A0A655UNF9_VIBCL|nr:Uncharacterised protein [Vibrio cholerae]CSA61757.1 Uncharacterised protein [Vibrio cholerae]CSB29040.1 Uncharacterised protein [Vibrio cholerae]CSB53918.1 Uncharacterised protein [Vibrio cholerae]CSB55034.1 Uncharacterised protein [Vibrio cholerae]
MNDVEQRLAVCTERMIGHLMAFTHNAHGSIH